MDIKKIEEKVRMMLRKAESTNFEAERDTFLAAAEKLILKHQLDRALLEQGDHEQATTFLVGKVEVRFEQFTQKWLRDVAAEWSSVVVNVLGYQGVWMKTRRAGGDFLVIYADDEALTIVSDLILHLAGICVAAAEEWWKWYRHVIRSEMGRPESAAERSRAKLSFCKGFYNTVCGRIAEEREEMSKGNEIVLSRDRYQLAAREDVGPLKQQKDRKVHDERALNAGHIAGEEADIHGKRRVSA